MSTATTLAALEQRLAAAGAPSLGAMRARRVGDVFRILNRQAIRDDDEWRLLNAIVSDLADRTLDDRSRTLAHRLLEEYEVGKKAADSVPTELD